MKIEVTQEDIDKGVRFSGVNCPIARAFKRSTNTWTDLLVIRKEALCLEVSYGKFIPIKRFPPHVTDFINRLDRRELVGPFVFEL